MADKTKWNIENTNFDHYFAHQSGQMVEAQRLTLPKVLYFKLFNRGGEVDTTSTSKLSFLAKLFILIKALRKRVIIMIEDENGMDEEQYFEYKRLFSKSKYDISSAEGLITDSVFVLGNKELFDTYHKLNSLSVSSFYNYAIKLKNKTNIKSSQSEYLSQVNHVVKTISFYEANRKNITMQKGIVFCEWLVLIYLFHRDKPVLGSDMYKKHYRYGYNSSAKEIKLAFGSLQLRGYITKIGQTRGAKMEITALGRDAVIGILNDYVLNA
jgi:hypothetical protein